MTLTPRTPIPFASPALAGEVSRASVTEGALSSCLPRPCGEGVTRSVTDGVLISPSGCHGLLRRTTRAPSSPSATHYTNTQVTPVPGCHHSTRSGAVVLLKPPKDTTARLRREWCHPDTTATLPSPSGVAGETSPATESTTTSAHHAGTFSDQEMRR